MAAVLPALLDDLAAETAALDAVLAPLRPQEWARQTPAAGWNITDQVSRNPADLALDVRGGAAQEWITIAQAFAGPPGPGRPPSNAGTAPGDRTAPVTGPGGMTEGG